MSKREAAPAASEGAEAPLGLDSADLEGAASAPSGQYIAVVAIDGGSQKWKPGDAFDGPDVEALLASGAIREA